MAQCQHRMRVQVQVPVVALSIQLQSNGLGKQQAMIQVLGPLHPRGDLDEALGSAPATAIILGVNQWMEVSLTYTVSLSLTLPFKRRVSQLLWGAWRAQLCTSVELTPWTVLQ